MTEPDWHGWKIKDGPALHIGHLPARKSVCLYVNRTGQGIDVLAYFRTEEDAVTALALIDDIGDAVPASWL